MSYSYVDGKDRIDNILNNNAEILEKDIPKDDSNFTYDNGVKSIIGSIFVDIIGSKKLIQGEEDIVVAKVLRSFTSEIIAIMNTSDNARQIGVRGDCVYGVFSTPQKKDVWELRNLTAYINNLVEMLNKLFTKKGYPTIKVGIGMAIQKDLIIKAGQKGTGINDKIWIGEAVVDACVLADRAGRDGNKTIGFSSIAYNNFIGDLEKRNSKASEWFTKKYNPNSEKYEYYANLVIPGFDKWIDENL